MAFAIKQIESKWLVSYEGKKYLCVCLLPLPNNYSFFLCYFLCISYEFLLFTTYFWLWDQSNSLEMKIYFKFFFLSLFFFCFYSVDPLPCCCHLLIFMRIKTKHSYIIVLESERIKAHYRRIRMVGWVGFWWKCEEIVICKLFRC